MPSTPGAGASGSSQAPATSPPVETILATALSHPNLVATYKVSSVRLRDQSGSGSCPSSGSSGEDRQAVDSPQLQLLPGQHGGLPNATALQEWPAGKGAPGLSAASSACSDRGGHMSLEALEEGRCPNGGPSPSTPMLVGDEGQHRQPSAALFETWMVLEVSYSQTAPAAWSGRIGCHVDWLFRGI